LFQDVLEGGTLLGWFLLGWFLFCWILVFNDYFFGACFLCALWSGFLLLIFFVFLHVGYLFVELIYDVVE
jgi:hypothetical protein